MLVSVGSLVVGVVFRFHVSGFEGAVEAKKGRGRGSTPKTTKRKRAATPREQNQEDRETVRAATITDHTLSSIVCCYSLVIFDFNIINNSISINQSCR